MSRFAFSCLVLLVWLPARASTNLTPATALLLDDKTVIRLTAELKQYENPPQLAGKLTSIGSGTATVLINRWAHEFATFFPAVELDIHGGGSADAMPAFLEGKVDLMPMSRPLWADEAARCKARFGYEPAQIVVAQDAIGVYVNKNNPIPGLTLAQLDAIYSREAKRGGARPEFWSDLGVTGPLAEERIIRICLSSVHGTHLFFRDYVMQGADYRFGGRFEAVSGSLVQAVGADETGIGFASVMFATARTRFVPLQAADGRYLLPSYENTLSGQYPLVRPMRIVFHRKPDGAMNPVAREFLRFAVSRRGQRIIALADSYPLTVEQQQDALGVIDGPP
ncbi:MAG: PstS family phosphate ABC transporter substrate-binding protein [Verrucomicrobiota bacterium]